MADPAKEIEALERVLFRLASIDADDRLLTVLDALLPQLLRLFPASTATPIEFQLKDKILQVITHIKTRLHAIPRPRLPLRQLSAVLNTVQSPFAANFAFLFIEMGFAAATREEQAAVLAALAKSLPNAGDGQQETFFRLILSTFPASAGDASEILSSKDAADIVLGFLLDLVLYQPSSGSENAVAFGLLTPRLERLQRVKVTTLKREALYDCQLHALQFVKQLGPSHPSRVLHFVAGAASFHHTIKSFCEDQLQRVVKDEDLAALEDATLCKDIMTLILSSQAASQGRPWQGRDAVLLSNRTRVADASILAAVNVLKASKAATNALPLVLQVICQLMFGDEPSRAQNVAQRIKIAGVKLCEWVLHHCAEPYLVQLMGPVLLPTLLRTLMDPNADLDLGNAAFWQEFRQFIYESISVMASRAPSLVTSTEQAFQVLLVRCLTEEANRSGANALKAMNSLRGAFEKSGENAVLAKIQSELIGLLKGTKLYDTTKNYQRVRTIVGEWAATLISHPKRQVASDDVSLRFALLRLCGDQDEGARNAASKALYTSPLPSLALQAKALQSLVGSSGSYNLQNVLGVREAQHCLRFLHAVMKKSRETMEDVETNGEQARRDVVQYFVQTLLQKPAESSSKQDVAMLYKDLTTQLLELHQEFPETIEVLVTGRGNAIIETMSRADAIRPTLLRLASIFEWSLPAVYTSEVQIVLEGCEATVKDSSATNGSVCGALYAVGTAVNTYSRQISESTARDQFVRRGIAVLTSSLQAAVASVANFSMLPRGEDALNEVFDRLRSSIDSVGLAGNWNELLANSTATDEYELTKKTRFDIITQLRTVLDWKLDGVTSDGNVKQKLTMTRMVALEAVAQVTRQATWPLVDKTALDELLTAIIQQGSVADAELQFAVGHALVEVGTCFVENEATSLATELITRVLRDCSEARQASVRRAATVWVLCMCTAGLNSESTSAQSAWNATFHSPTFAKTIVDVHEFFVTMLNDADPVTTECAVKGLAYLRLKAPTTEVGDQFSDSLFRRLRCFRAFAPITTPAGGRAVNDDDDDQDMEIPPPPANTNNGNGSENATVTPAPPRTRDTVENVAYREVSNVAADIGDPELMYSLLYLSTTNPIWQALSVTNVESAAFDSASFSFVAVDHRFRKGIIERASTQWMSDAFEHRKKLIPWLFLLKNHSNSKVAEVMNNLWNFAKGELVVSTSQEKSLLAQQWDTILQFLLTKLEHSRNFKYREACCGALIDLLNGANAEDIEGSFVRLWKLTSRSVDDIMEAVAVAGLKLFKALGELSLRIAVKHEGCRRELLDYLISQGMVTKNVVCRALSIDLLLRLVKEVDASALQDRLGALMLQLLEYLSSLEMPELQYAQFHVDKKDQLERLRVSLSQSGPVGQLLDQCMLKLKALATSDDVNCTRIVDEISRGVSSLLKFGVGLNTRVGTANFVATLSTELPFELRKCGGAELILSRALMPYVSERSAAENDLYGDEDARYESKDGSSTGSISDGLMLQSYLRAAAYLSPLAEPVTVKRYVRSGIFAVHRRRAEQSSNDASTVPEERGFADSDTYTSRFLLVSALATKELLAKCPPITDATTLVSADNRNEWYAADVFPAAFIGQFASSEAVRNVWTAVLEDLPPRITYAEAALNATLAVLARWIRHPSWDTRRQGVKALQALFSSGSSYRSKLSPQQTDQIWNELLAAVPGRLWRGKGVILEALVAIAGVRVDEWQPLSALLVEECDRAWKNHDLEYLESGLVSLSALTNAMPATQLSTESLRLQIVSEIRTRLEVWRAPDTEDDNALSAGGLPPMLVKVVFETLGAVFPNKISGDHEQAAAQTTELLQWLDSCVSRASFHVWSVRRSVFGATASVVRGAPAAAFTSQRTINKLVERSCGELGVGDAKYSMVRIAAGDVLAALASRHAEPVVGLQLTAHRERLSEAVDVLRGSEEPKEQQVAAQIFTQLTESAAA